MPDEQQLTATRDAQRLPVSRASSWRAMRREEAAVRVQAAARRKLIRHLNLTHLAAAEQRAAIARLRAKRRAIARGQGFLPPGGNSVMNRKAPPPAVALPSPQRLPPSRSSSASQSIGVLGVGRTLSEHGARREHSPSRLTSPGTENPRLPLARSDQTTVQI